MGKKTVQTIADIARLAEVSKSTVSRALNNSPLISDETKGRILAIAKQYNFQLNAPARRLSLKKSRTIAMVTYTYHVKFSLEDLFGLEVMGGISNGLYENGYDMLLIHVDPRQSDWVHRYLDTGRVDGFVLMTSSKKSYHIKALLEMGAPFIVWGAPLPKYSYCSVTGDNTTGGRLATEYLIQSGRQRIGFIGGPPDEVEVMQRLEGYQHSLQAAGCSVDPQRITYGDFSSQSGRTAMRALLEQAPDVDAVFANSDLMALGAIDVIRERGYRVPEDIAVVGYDDISVSEYYRPALTTVRQNTLMAGNLLARNLIQYLQTGVVTNVTMPVELVVRQSA